MQDYRVELDVYHGPLDLLLYLIKRDEIDIHDIPIAPIAEQFMRHVQTLKTLDIELAGEFLVMAATLMEIKSAMMLPRDEVAEDEAATSAQDPADPRYELVQQLLAYKRFKDAADALDRRRETFAARFPRKPARHEQAPAPEPQLDLEDASVWDLLEAFTTLMEQVGDLKRVHEVVVDDTPVELHAADIVDRLQREGAMTLQAMFAGRTHVGELLGLFLATLELIRQRKVRARQESVAGEIRLELMPEEEQLGEDDEAGPRPQYDPTNAENFDWPDEQTRRRYVRRQERRARGEFIEEDAELEADIAAIEAEEAAEVAPPPPVSPPPATQGEGPDQTA